MSFNPNTGLVYLPGNEASWTYTPDPNFKYEASYWNTGMAMGRRLLDRMDNLLLSLRKQTGPAKEPEGAENKPKAKRSFPRSLGPPRSIPSAGRSRVKV